MITQQKKRKMNPMLLNVLLISGGLHLIAIFVLGGITIVKYIIPDEAQFEEPPEVAEEVPPPEVKIEIKQQPAPQKNSMQSLQMKQVGNITVDAVDVNLPDMADSFTVSGGLGGLGSGGSLLGGTRGTLGIGMSDVNVFGLKARADRILFLIDANREMLTDKKGGLNSYQLIKDEITDMVGNLSAGTLFNVILTDKRRALKFKPQLVPAGQEVHKELVEWIGKINRDPNRLGLEHISEASVPLLRALKDEDIHSDIVWNGNRRGNETALMTQNALEQNVDAIFIITAYHRGFERVRRQLTDREQDEYDRLVASQKYQDQLAAHNAERIRMRKRIDSELARINAERAKRGQPPKVLSGRHGILSDVDEMGFQWETRHPGHPPLFFRDPPEVEKYFRELVKTLYDDKGTKKPSINVIVFLGGDEEWKKEWDRSLNKYTRFFRGKNRIIRGFEGIKSAQSAATTTNN